MRYFGRLVVLAAGLVIASGSAAHALDFCFDPGTSFPNTSSVVARSFKKPGRGRCTPVHGFDTGTSIPRRLVTGTACLNTAGDRLLVAYTVVSTDTLIGPQHATLSLPYPSLQSGYGQMTNDGSGTGVSVAATGAFAGPCFMQGVPIP
jgi:hypothetical protein